MEMKVAGIVVYEPDINRLKENVKAISVQVDKLIIFCNSDFEKESLEYNNIIYLNDGVNRGIAYALNEIMNQALNMGVEWCLLLDQDSVVPSNIISEFDKYTQKNDVAIITPQILCNQLQECKTGLGVEKKYIDMCITSGSYNKVSVWKSVGGFLEDFFIDYVDWEYCARVRKYGYKIFLVESILLNHQLGNISYHYLGKYRISTYNHSAFRKYYITRNSIVTYKLYPYEKKLQHPYLRVVKRFVIVVMFEKGKYVKCRAIIKGLNDVNKLYKKISSILE